jgi:hypothetical protein
MHARLGAFVGFRHLVSDDHDATFAARRRNRHGLCPDSGMAVAPNVAALICRICGLENCSMMPSQSTLIWGTTKYLDISSSSIMAGDEDILARGRSSAFVLYQPIRIF